MHKQGLSNNICFPLGSYGGSTYLYQYLINLMHSEKSIWENKTTLGKTFDMWIKWWKWSHNVAYWKPLDKMIHAAGRRPEIRVQKKENND